MGNATNAKAYLEYSTRNTSSGNPLQFTTGPLVKVKYMWLAGQTSQGTTPIAGTDRASFLEYPNSTIYFCGHCNSHTPVDVVMHYKNWTFRQAADEIRKIAGHIEVYRPKKPDMGELDKVLKGYLS